MPDPTPQLIPFARPFAPFFPPSSRGPGRDGSFDFLPFVRRAGGGGSAPDPVLYAVLGHGQSNQTGANATPALSTSPAGLSPNPKMFSGGVRTSGATSGSPTATDLSAQTLVDLVEADAGGGGETFAWAATRQLAIARPGKKFFASTHARNGSRYDQINKGTGPYTEAIGAATRLVALNAPSPVVVLAVAMKHGEADQAFARTNYAGNLLTYWTDLNTDIKAATGQTRDIFLLVDQQHSGAPGNVTAFNGGYSTAFETYKAARDNPTKIVLTGARYMWSYQQVDGGAIHLSQWSQRAAGDREGQILNQLCFGSGSFRPVSPIVGQVNFSSGPGGAATNTVVINFHVPTPPLVLDFSWVGRVASPLCGFSFFDDSGAIPTVTAVALTGPAQVTLTLSGVPTGSAGSRAVRYAMGTNGNSGPFSGDVRGNLRDSSTWTAFDGTPLHNWCVIFHEAVT